MDGVDLQTSNIKKDYGINILFKKENNTEVLPDAKTVFEIGDTIIVMGSEENVRKIFDLKEPGK